jgi:MFS family permease
VNGLSLAAVGIAVVAAVRSTWSPCGQSMLSSITPLSEAGRGRRYGATAAFFVTGAVLGGAVVGLAAAVLAAGIGALGLSTGQRSGLLAVAALAGAAVDAGHTPLRTPFLRRQVNEDWLSRYRAWVYGGGFGFQIGTGVMTYIMTTAVPLTIGAAALTGSPSQALVVLVVFGAVRGAAIFAGAGARSFVQLQRLHRRFEAWREPVRRLTIAGLGITGSVLAVGVWPSVAAAGLALTAVLVATARPADPGTNPALAPAPPRVTAEPALG